jgi:drug/metabolite transporter (DMT)-like permease
VPALLGYSACGKESPVAVGREGVRRNRHVLVRHAAVLQWRASRLPPNFRGLMWATGAGLAFALLNTLMRRLTEDIGAFETQFLRYAMGLAVMLPLVVRAGIARYIPHDITGQFTRGAVHTVGLVIWFHALPFITIADTTAIGFTTPIFIMLGAAWMFRERMRWERWLAAGIGLAGVLVVVAPKLAGTGGGYTLVMLASSPVFALSFLMTKQLTRNERPAVIVAWQSISVSLLSLPMALMHWTWPGPWHWLAFATCGLLGSLGHYLLTRSFSVTDISATQSVKFLDLVWATLLGWLAFGDSPSRSTLVGGAVICASTLWIAQREARRVPAL